MELDGIPEARRVEAVGCSPVCSGKPGIPASATKLTASRCMHLLPTILADRPAGPSHPPPPGQLRRSLPHARLVGGPRLRLRGVQPDQPVRGGTLGTRPGLGRRQHLPAYEQQPDSGRF